MSPVLYKGVIRSGRVEVAQPIDLPDGSEVIITGHARDELPGLPDSGRPMSPAEIAAAFAAMDQVEPFDMTAEERAAADAWEKKVNEYSIASTDRGIEDAYR